LIAVEDMTIEQGAFALRQVSFTVEAGQYGVLMGRTGSGKTTIIEAICGLRKLRSGQVRLNGRDVTHLRPAQRDVGYVPQDGALFSTMKVRDQLAFSLTVRRAPRSQVTQRVGEMADLLEITHLLDRTPGGLSGGDKQRVALGRALAFHPRILLLDEPLSALDEDTRGRAEAMLKRVQRTTHVTVLHITHSMSEARRLADQLYRIEDGRVVRGNGQLPESTA
jgi:molybdate/tungstate transport system ATP-binding protein